jgi:hypothetical protein
LATMRMWPNRQTRAPTMLSLESPEWANLHHAYGPASDIPRLLRQLDTLPLASGNAEPWFSIWSALAHQGDVYTASFAAIPHVVRVLATAPAMASYSYFQFPAWVEICRRRHNISVPDDLAPDYFEALNKLPKLVGAAAVHEWDVDFLTSAMSALAVSKGFFDVAEAALELRPDVAEEFLKWFAKR